MAFERVTTGPGRTKLLSHEEREMMSSADQLNAAADDVVDADADATPPKTPIELEDPGPEVKVGKPDSDVESKSSTKDERDKRELLESIKKKPEVLQHADQFLLEISGITPFSKTYEFGGVLSLVFETVDTEHMSLVNQQCVRDMGHARMSVIGERWLLSEYYRLACSLTSLRIVDPQSKRVHREYSLALAKQEVLELTGGICEPNDLLPRRLWRHLQMDVLKTQMLQERVTMLFSEFEQLLRDLTTLVELDPDFFSQGSSTTGSPN